MNYQSEATDAGVAAAVERYIELRTRIEAEGGDWGELAEVFTDGDAYVDCASGRTEGKPAIAVRQLEGTGAVRRSSDPDDGRVAMLELTAKGWRMAENLRAVGVRHLEDALRGRSEADSRALAALLAEAHVVPVSTGQAAGGNSSLLDQR